MLSAPGYFYPQKKSAGFSYGFDFFADIIGRDEGYLLNIESRTGRRLPAGDNRRW